MDFVKRNWNQSHQGSSFNHPKKFIESLVKFTNQKRKWNLFERTLKKQVYWLQIQSKVNKSKKSPTTRKPSHYYLWFWDRCSNRFVWQNFPSINVHFILHNDVFTQDGNVFHSDLKRHDWSKRRVAYLFSYPSPNMASPADNAAFYPRMRRYFCTFQNGASFDANSIFNHDTRPNSNVGSNPTIFADFCTRILQIRGDNIEYGTLRGWDCVLNEHDKHHGYTFIVIAFKWIDREKHAIIIIQ